MPIEARGGDGLSRRDRTEWAIEAHKFHGPALHPRILDVLHNLGHGPLASSFEGAPGARPTFPGPRRHRDDSMVRERMTPSLGFDR